MRFLILLVTAVLYTIADEKCYKFGLLSTDCNSNEGKARTIRAAPGPPGNDGKNGNPCKSSESGLNAIQQTLQGSEQSMNKNWKQLQESFKKIDELKNTCLKAANSQQSGGGSSGNGYSDVGKIFVNNIPYQFFDYNPTIAGAWEICNERGGEVAFLNLLSSVQRRNLFRKLNLKRGTEVWLNAKATIYPVRVVLAFLDDGSYVYIPSKDFYKRFGFTTVSTAGCLVCRDTHCRVVNCKTQTSKVICQFPRPVPSGPSKQVLSFPNKLTWDKSRSFCRRIGGDLAFKFIKTEQQLMKWLKHISNSQWPSHNNGMYWIGGFQIVGSFDSYKFIDGTVIDDQYKFPWKRPEYPGGSGRGVRHVYYYKGGLKWSRDMSRNGYGLEKNIIRENWMTYNYQYRYCMVLEVKYSRETKKMEYGVITKICGTGNSIKPLCEFTKPTDNYADAILGHSYVM